MTNFLSISQKSVLNLYYNLLRVVRTSSEIDRMKALAEIRGTFRNNLKETDTEKIANLLRYGESRLSFAKMSIPRLMMPRQRGVPKESTSTSFIVKDGKVVEGHADRPDGRSYIDKRIDQGDLDRHNRLTKRYYFQR
eukprot:TRINITY_DN942_c0_g1_i1.p1 TRINITY_DN942_c0_g1~~TRINITY_DN942_c0_g1_i1.p1  ORF type:complete len:137 (+),score=15.48 TRINITY_DN942_c0_g1_i1:66-476(+)